MKDMLIMSPGPTDVNEEVFKEMTRKGTNPGLDIDFFHEYKNATNKYNKIIKSNNDSYILSGEGILGLEAACASLTEVGDKVLCITNGIFGDGFEDFIKMYGGEVTVYKGDYERAININELETFLEKNNDFKYATLVHCETPSGITNPLMEISQLLNKYNILSVVDSVSAIGGEEVKCDEWQIDILVGGSQKCLSFIPGLTFVTISENAWKAILNRATPIAGFYSNLLIWKDVYKNKKFPYTQPTQLIYGVSKAFDIALEGDFVKIHKDFGTKTRKALIESGLTLYPKDGFSNTVTTIMLPEGLDFANLLNLLKDDHRAIVAGGFGFLENKVFRIGHMGENNNDKKLIELMNALDETFEKLDIKLNASLENSYRKQL